MSILVEANPLDPHLLPALAAATAVAVVLAIAAKVFRPGSIQGPARLAAQEPASSLLVVLLAGVGIWLAAPSLYAAHVAGTHDLSSIQTITANLLAEGSGLAMMLLLASWIIRPGGLGQLGFGRVRLWRGVWAGLIGVGIVLPLMIWVMAGTETIYNLLHYQHAEEVKLLQIMGQSNAESVRAVIVVMAVVVAPLFEELLFRGHLQTWLGRVTGEPWIAVLVTAAVFAGIHEPWSMPPIFVLAVCLGYVYERTGSLWASILIHAAFNGFSIFEFLKG